MFPLPRLLPLRSLTTTHWLSRQSVGYRVVRRMDAVRLVVEELAARFLPSFGPPMPVVPVNPFASTLATGDFNGDGLPDLVVGSFDSDHVDVLLNNGDGTFRNAGNIPAALTTSTLVVADFNGDGIPDIATAGLGPDSGSVLLGNGDGTFQAPLFFNTGVVNVTDLQVGDFNGDGIPDLVTVDGGFSGAQANLLLGVGDGTFAASHPILSDPNATSQSAAVGDFNGDGLPDLAFTLGHRDGMQVTVFLGHGDGTFRDPVAYATDNFPESVVVADLTGDGVLDLAVGGVTGVDVLRGRGDGTFGPAVLTPFKPRSGRLFVADLNQDGIPDLITEPFGLPGTGEVLVGNGDGTFQPAQQYEAGQMHLGLAVADFNRDAFPDLAVVGPEGEAFILINQADWSTSPGGGFPHHTPSGVGAGDGSAILTTAGHAPEVRLAPAGTVNQSAAPGDESGEAVVLPEGTQNREAIRGESHPFRHGTLAAVPTVFSLGGLGDGFPLSLTEGWR